MSRQTKVRATQDSIDRDLVKALMELRIADVAPIGSMPPPSQQPRLLPEIKNALKQTPIPQELLTPNGDLNDELLQNPHRIDFDAMHTEEDEPELPIARTIEVLDVDEEFGVVHRQCALTDSDDHGSESEPEEHLGMYPSEYSDDCENPSRSGSRYSDGDW